ncbi:class I SAM-dependent methyltransferase [Agrococcus sp. 1P02AA]|uniref:class I SAM-dependent methyltransferase n=1 Tax=Agrococcus sp. 1P02AA TaxID=3132259 RepID=UPI0039A71DA3
MPTAPQPSPAPHFGQMRPDHYDEFADGYEQANASSLFNAYYERPAMLELAGDVRGRRVLDAGCGSGPLALALRERGAAVSGFDGSAAMIELARQRLGASTPLAVLDLAAPLPYPDGAFDDVIASLVLHYLEDWTTPLAECFRILVPGGRLLLSVNHPTGAALGDPGEDYFATRPYTDRYDFAGTDADLTFWHRPLHAMSDAFAAAGFRMLRISEPRPAADTPPELLPPRLRTGERTAFIGFLLVVLERR